MTIKVQRSPLGYKADAVVETRWGPVMVHAEAPAGFINQALNTVGRPQITAVAGDMFGDVFSALGQVAAVAQKPPHTFGETMGVVSQLANSPLAKMGAAALGGPVGLAALGVTAQAAGAAQMLAARGRAGDPAAHRDIADIAKGAQAGLPAALRAASLLRAAFAGQAAQDAAASRVASASGALPPDGAIPLAQLVGYDEYRRQMAQQQGAPVALKEQPDGSWAVPWS